MTSGHGSLSQGGPEWSDPTEERQHFLSGPQMPCGKLRQPDALGNVVLGNFGSYHLCKCSTDVYTHLSTAGDHGCPTRAPDSPSRGSTQGQPSMGQGCPGSKPGNQHYQLNPFFFLRCVLSRHYPCICH